MSNAFLKHFEWLISRLKLYRITQWIIPQFRIRYNEKKISILGVKYDAEEMDEVVSALICFTYRNGFVCISDTEFSTDAGWGCMIRCGQMMLAQALVTLNRENDREQREKRIVALFADDPNAPFSIHRITLENTVAGKWMGPTQISQTLATLYERFSLDLPDLAIYVAMDAILYRDEIRAITARNTVWRPLLLIIPVRLGLNCINPQYEMCIGSVFDFPQCLGILGGRPRAAHYFVGRDCEQLIYLDPHAVHPALHASAPDIASCHCSRHAQSMPLLDIDPSLAFGFLCETAAQFEDLCMRCSHITFLSIVETLPELTTVYTDYNCVFAMDEDSDS